MTTLNEVNMKYVSSEFNEETANGAILACSNSWTTEGLEAWLDGYDYDAIESVLNWVKSPCHIAEGLFLKVWAD